MKGLTEQQLAFLNQYGFDAELQQRWQQEAQAVPLDRKTEQKLWEVFRKPIDEAFQRKGSERSHGHAPLSARDRAVIDASRALDAANAKGDAAAIRAAMSALEAALKHQAAEAAQPAPAAAPALEAAPEPAPETTEPASPEPAAEATEAAAPVVAPRPAKPVVAVRGDDRPGQKKTEPVAAGKPGRRDGRPGERGADRGGDRFGRPERGERRDVREDRREDRGPRLGDEAFRAQREARERAETALRKLAAQAHGAGRYDQLSRILSSSLVTGLGVSAITLLVAQPVRWGLSFVAPSEAAALAARLDLADAVNDIGFAQAALDLALFWPQAPHTALTGKLQVKPDGPAWRAQGEVRNSLPGPWDHGRLPLDAAQGVFDHARGQWTLQSLSATLGSGSLQVQIDAVPLRSRRASTSASESIAARAAASVSRRSRSRWPMR